MTIHISLEHKIPVLVWNRSEAIFLISSS